MSTAEMFSNATSVFGRLADESHEDYYSDEVDSDVEELLYSLIHHSQSDNSPIHFDRSGEFKKRKEPEKIEEEGTRSPVSNKRPRVDRPSRDNYFNISTSSRGSKAPNKKVSSSKGECTEIIDIQDSDDEAGHSSTSSSRSLWHVDIQDIMVQNPNPRISSLYQSRKFCSRCRRVGNHPVKLCHLREEKICHICGNTGHHSDTCQNIICFKCHGYHRPNKCLSNWKKIFCDVCKTYGHCDTVCTTHWRKYFGTTDPSINPDILTRNVAVNKRKSCSMCGQKHFIFECHRYKSVRPDSRLNMSSNSLLGHKSPSPKRKKSETVKSHSFQQSNNRKFKINSQPKKLLSPPSAMMNFSNKLSRKNRQRIRALKYQRFSLQNKSKKC